MFVSKNEMEQHRTNHADRYNGIEDSIPGTRSYHQFVPLSRDRVGAKRCSDDEQFACTHDFNISVCLLIPRIKFCPRDANLPFILERDQFPIRLSFSITINKSQAQIFEKVAIISS